MRRAKADCVRIVQNVGPVFCRFVRENDDLHDVTETKLARIAWELASEYTRLFVYRIDWPATMPREDWESSAKCELGLALTID